MNRVASSNGTLACPAEVLISVVIPTLNEASNLATTLENVVDRCSAPQRCEIILVDGGSTDTTISVAQKCTPALEECGLNLHIFCSTRGRARQMNYGAEHARGDILVFLHADTLLPHHFDKRIRTTLKSEHLTLGAFSLMTDRDTPGMKWICWWANMRSRLFTLPYGDQAMFIRGHDFVRVQKFPPLEIMEDFALVRQVKRHKGEIHILPDAVFTSARRWRKRGYLFTTLCNQIMILGYYLRIPTRILARWYRR